MGNSAFKMGNFHYVVKLGSKEMCPLTGGIVPTWFMSVKGTLTKDVVSPEFNWNCATARGKEI